MHEAIRPPAEYGFTEPAEVIAYHEAVVRGLQAALIFGGSEAGRALVQEHYNATHDRLTGLLNYAGMEEVIEFLGTEVEGIGVLYLDATNFKAVNDRIGHDKGDTILCEIASVIRTDDYAARIGGDEFLVLLMPSHDVQEGSRVAPLRMADRIHLARLRIDKDMQAVLGRHPEAAALGLQLAVGATLGSVGRTIARLKAQAETDMKEAKAVQHRLLGRYRGD